jgi:nucleoside-diphosphate kinase
VTERTLVLIKPDGVQRALVGRIIERYEQRGLRLVGLKMVHVDRALAEEHYAVHRDKPFFAGLVEFIVSAPLVALALEGPNAIAVCRAINGATRPHEAAPGSIRGDFALETGQNLVHASDSAETAPPSWRCGSAEDELFDYPRDIDRWVVGRPSSPPGACPRPGAYSARAPWPGGPRAPTRRRSAGGG